jgi:hypothetical protein
MYSPADLPSSTRAAPAKNRIWSHIGGTSSDVVSSFGLPVFCVSTSTSSSARSSIASAIRSSARWRSLGVVCDQLSNARAESWNAASMSASRDSGAVANTSPVLGSTRSVVWPSAAATRSPWMKFVISVGIGAPMCGRWSGSAARRGPDCGRRSRWA